MRYLILVFSLLVVTFGWSQQIPFEFKGRVSNADNGGYEGGVTVTVVQNGASVLTAQTASNGKYNLTGPIDKSQAFDIVFSKGGMVSKMVHFDFAKMNEEDIPPGEFRPVESLDLDIFAGRPGIDFEFLNNEPVASFDWNTRDLQPRLDGAGASAMKKRIADLLSSAEKEEQELEENYQKAITAADAAYDAQKYEEALEKYEEALGYKPTEKHPSDRIVELDALIKAQKEKELADQQSQQEYDNLIAAADNLRGQDKLAEAVSKYKEASNLRSSEQYPKDQIAALEAKIEQAAKEAAAQEAYDAAMEKGEAFLKQNSYKAARDKFQEASTLKPSEQLPKDKLALIEEKLKEAEAVAEKKQKYDDAIAAADAAFNAEDYMQAKAKYEEALTFEASSSYAKGRLQICNEKLADVLAEQERQQKIADLLKEGQLAIDAKTYDDAIGKFDEVLTLEAENAEAKEKKELAQKLKAEAEQQAASEQQFNDLVAKGDNAVATQNWEEGISKYEEALTLKTDAAVETKLSDAKAKLQEQKDLAEKGAQFQSLIDEGNQLLADGKLEASKAKFVAAKAIDETSPIPQTKIAEIDALLADQQADAQKKESYDAAIAAADGLYGQDKWTEAKAKYEEALTFATDPTYANGKIEEIKGKISANEEAAAKEAKYQAAITAADGFYGQEKWTEAKSKYEEALTFATDPAYANGKIEEIKGKISANEEAAAREAQYKAAIEAGDNAFNAEKWNEAKAKFTEALGFTSDPSYAQGKIDAIDKKIADEQSSQAKAAEIAALLADGQTAYDNGKLEEARTNYEKVVALEASNEIATKQIEKINAELAALQSEAQKEENFARLKKEGFDLAAAEKYPEALSKLQEALSLKQDNEVQTKIDAIKEIQSGQQEVASLLLDGEALYSDQKYDDSKAKFEAVLSKDPGNATAQAGLEKVNKAIEAQSESASKEAQFEKLKEEGIAFKEKEKYDDAKAKLNAALDLKEDDQIRKLLEEIRQKELALSQTNSVDTEYNNLMDDAADLTASGSFDEAIKKYKEAKLVKPEETEPDAKIAALKDQIEKEKEQAKVDAEYRGLIEAGDQLVAEEKYIEAIESFNKALALKPSEKEPVDKARNAEELAKNSKKDADKAVEKNLRIAEEKINAGEYDRANQILNSTEGLGPGPERIAEIETLRERIKTFKKRDADYADRLAEGEKAVQNNKLEKALEAYREANRLKENEQLPKDKIAELEERINDAASSEQREKLYQEFMDKGQSNQDNGNYEAALSNYQNALQAKKGDVAASDKVSEIQQILDNLANELEKDQELRNKFNAIIAQADAKFTLEEYLPAKSKYEEALQLIPTDSYAKLRVEECLRRESTRSDQLAEEQYRKLIDAADKNLDNKNYETAKERYTNAVAMRSNDPYPKKKLAEIEAILNPPNQTSIALVDPGIPISGSILDGQALLQNAQEQRDAYEKQKLQSKMDAADQEISEISLEKQLDRESARQEIVEVYEGIGEYGSNADMKRNENVEILRKAEKGLEASERENTSLNYNANVGDQQQLNQITESVALNYGERSEVYMDNAETMDAYENALAEAFALQAGSDYGSSISSDQSLIKAKETIVSEMIDDYEERDEVRQQVQDVQTSVTKANDALAVADYNVNHEAKGVIEDVYINVDNKSVEDAKKSHDNSEELKGIQAKINTTSTDLGTSETIENYAASETIDQIVIKYDNKAIADAEAVAQNGEELRGIATKINDKSLEMGLEETAFAYSADRQMEGYKQKTQSTMSGMDDNRKEAVEVLKQSNKELAAAQAGTQENNHVKSRENKQIIDNETRLNGAISEKADAANGANVAGVEALNEKAQANYTSEVLSDEQERQNAQNGIANVYEANSDNATSATDKQAENSEKLDQSKKVIDSDFENRSDATQDKVYGAADQIHKIDNAPSEKAIIANSLGEEYPEGVTEESFAQNDQNGLMKSIVTRRIVVIEGHADVYLRTQSLGNITYSKNGKPITEHDWNSQTQGPNLVRHTK